jgi:hypothetical protein
MKDMELEFKYSKNKKNVLFIFDDLYCYNDKKTKKFKFEEKKYTIYNYSMNVFCNIINENQYGISCGYYNKKHFYFDGNNGNKKK